MIEGGFVRKKRLIVVMPLLLSLFGMAWAAPDSSSGEDGKVDYTLLISKLAVLIDPAERCGELLNSFGKRALSAPPCKVFHDGFYKEWPDRDTLRSVLAAEFAAVEQGRRPCDEDCRARLQRIEELRVTLTYYLDYMDFVVEMDQME